MTDTLDPYLDEFRDNPRGPTTPLAVREAIGNDPDLGEKPDPVLAARYNVPVTVVRYVRQKKGVEGKSGKPGGLTTEEAKALAETRWQAVEAAKAAAPAAPPPPPRNAPREAARPLPAPVQPSPRRGHSLGGRPMSSAEGRSMAAKRWDQTAAEKVAADPELGRITDMAMSQKHNVPYGICRRVRIRAGFDKVRAAWKDDPDLWRIPATQFATKYAISPQAVTYYKRQVGGPENAPAPRPPVPGEAPPPPTPPPPSEGPRAEARALRERIRVDPMLGKEHDTVTARRHQTSQQTVWRVRTELGLPTYVEEPAWKRDPMIGWEPDEVVGKRHDVPKEVIFRFRKQHGIPSATERAGLKGSQWIQPEDAKRREEIAALLQADPKLSNREISRQTQADQGTVRDVRESLGMAPASKGERSEIARQVAADGGTVEQAAEAAGLSYSAAYTAIRRGGMTPNTARVRSEIAREVAASGGTVAEAAEASGLTPNAARKVLARAGVRASPAVPSGRVGAPPKVDWDNEPRLGKMPDAELAALLGVDRSAVAHARKVRGIPPYKAPSTTASLTDEDWIKAGLLDEGRTLQQVADALGSSKATASRVLRRLVGGEP